MIQHESTTNKDALPLDNYYALLACLLSPCREQATTTALRSAAQHGLIDWGRLLYMANCHLCTPLWFVRLQKDDLLDLLPKELQEYLSQLHQANIERNSPFRHELKAFLEALAEEEILAVLLKGGVTFVDDLYGDPGARVMGDIDILFKPADVEKARNLLVQSGYVEIPDPRMTPEGLPTDCRHHQLPRYYKPGTPVVIEIHFKVSYGHAGRVVTAEEIWDQAIPRELDGVPVFIPCLDKRLIHNAVHALLPAGEFIRGNISLLQLTEFVFLCRKAGIEKSWGVLEETISRHGLRTEFYAYWGLARRIMNLPSDFSQIDNRRVSFAVKRFLLGGIKFGTRKADESRPSYRWRLWTEILLKSYYYLSLPHWVWSNVCYAEGEAATYARFRLLLKKLLSSYSRAKIGF